MAENNNARTRLLILIDILKLYSNENHVLSIEEICSYLEEYGYHTTKRNVIADIKLINTTTHEIIYVTKPKKGYYIAREFNLLAVDALLAAIYSNEKLTREERQNAETVLNEIISLPTRNLLINTTARVAPDIPRQPVSGENIMLLRKAIFEKKKVTLTYTVTCLSDSFSTPEKEKHLTVNPIKIAISPNSTLFVFTQPGSTDAECMQLCRIKAVEILEEDVEVFKGDIFSAKGFFTGMVIKDRHAKADWVLLKIRVEDAEFVRNFFDSPVQFRKCDSEGYCYAKIYTILDERFIGWIFCFVDKIEIIAPQELKDYFTEKYKLTT